MCLFFIPHIPVRLLRVIEPSTCTQGLRNFTRATRWHMVWHSWTISFHVVPSQFHRSWHTLLTSFWWLPMVHILKSPVISRTPWLYPPWYVASSLNILRLAMCGHTSILADPQETFPPRSLSPLSGTLFLCGTFLLLQCLFFQLSPAAFLSLPSTALTFPPFYLKIICFLVMFLYCFIWCSCTVHI